MLRFLLLLTVSTLGLHSTASAQSRYDSIQKRLKELEVHLSQFGAGIPPEKIDTLNQRFSSSLFKALIYTTGNGMAHRVTDRVETLAKDFLKAQAAEYDDEGDLSFGLAFFAGILGCAALTANEFNPGSRLGGSIIFFAGAGTLCSAANSAWGRADDTSRHKIEYLTDVKGKLYPMQEAFEAISTTLDLGPEKTAIFRAAWQDALDPENPQKSLTEILIDTTDAKGEPILEDWQIQGLQELEKITLDSTVQQRSFDIDLSEREKLVERLKMIHQLIYLLQEHLAERRSSEVEKVVDAILSEVDRETRFAEVVIRR